MLIKQYYNLVNVRLIQYAVFDIEGVKNNKKRPYVKRRFRIVCKAGFPRKREWHRAER